MDASQPLRVWAPVADEIDLVLKPGGQTSLERHEDGWFVGPRLAPGIRYRLRVFGGPADGRTITDPASHSLPNGIFGPGQAVDHEAFRWSDRYWDGGRGADRRRASIYELHVGTFTSRGTFVGAAARLPDLAELGVTHVELLPCATFMGHRGWGYDGVMWWAPHYAYGGVEGMKRFVDAAHRAGIAVLLDVVYNHLGPEGDTTWALWPIKNPRHQTPWGDAINLDGEGSAGIRRLILDNALGWLRHYHLDGLRLDAVHALVDDSPTHLLTELSSAVDDLAVELGRPLWLTAESEHRTPDEVMPREAGGQGLHASWADDLHHTIHSVLTGETAAYYAPYGTPHQVAATLVDPYAGRSPGSAGDAPAERFVVCAQNHDQVGNRARGERLHQLVGAEAAMAAAALVICSPQVPLLFMGEEWAASTPWPFFANPQDAELAEAIRTGRRREFVEFGWAPEDIPDPVATATFESAVLRWTEVAEGGHATTRAFYRRLLELLATHPDLGAGAPDDTEAQASAAGTVALRRGRVLVVAHLRPDPAEHEVGPDWTVLAATPSATLDGPTIRFPGPGALVISVGG
ncbi:MAG: malto-oligosyltrehalose trehalohydrolase [Acidimicrobiales bacterium]